MSVFTEMQSFFSCKRLHLQVKYYCAVKKCESVHVQTHKQ